jgi:hypothetical protein
LKLTNELLGRMVLGSNSPCRLRKARDCFATWASEGPQNSGLQVLLTESDGRLKVLGKKEPGPVHISSRARDVVEELDLPDVPMLELLSEAEILIEADGNDPEKTYELMVQAAWEYATLIVLADVKRQIQ